MLLCHGVYASLKTRECSSSYECFRQCKLSRKFTFIRVGGAAVAQDYLAKHRKSQNERQASLKMPSECRVTDWSATAN